MTHGIKRGAVCLYTEKNVGPKQGGPVELYYFQNGIESTNAVKLGFKVMSPNNSDSKNYYLREHTILTPIPKSSAREISNLQAGKDETQLSEDEGESVDSALSEEMIKLSMQEQSTQAAPTKTFKSITSNLRKASTARLQMAYARCISRRKRNKAEYKKIFDIESYYWENKEKKLQTSTYLGTKSYNEFSELTLKKKCKLPLKKIFEVLQVYHLVEKEPVLVKLLIGGIPAQFMMSPWPVDNDAYGNQVLISTRSHGKGKYNYEGRAYWELIAIIKGIPNNRILAKKLLQCLKYSSDNQSDFLSKLDLNEKQISAVIEFLALIQIGESSYGSCLNMSRTPGMNKLARKILRDIRDMKCGWSVFEKENTPGAFPPIGPGGTSFARNLATSFTHQSIGSYASASLMSDDSDVS